MGKRGEQRGRDSTPTEYRRVSAGPIEFRHAAPKKGKRKRSAPVWTKLCLAVGILFILTSATGLGVKLFLTSRYDHNINRDDLVPDDLQRAVDLDGPINFLILGTDKRTADDYDPNDESSNTWTTPGPARADTIMWVHVPKGEKKAYVVSIPRDSYVHIPESTGGEIEWYGGEERINAAYAFGGAPLMLRTLKELTGVVPDFPVLVNFEAVREITDAVGGVDVTVTETTQDYRTLEIFEAGRQHLNGERADAYVRQRKAICSDIFPVTNPRRKGAECGLPRGDYDRQARQQQYLAALSHRIDEKGITNKPGKLDQLLRVITKNLTVDENMPVQDLVFSLKTLGQEDLTFLSLPMLGSQTLDSGAIVEAVDEEQTDALFTAMKNGTLPEYVATYGANDTTEGA